MMIYYFIASVLIAAITLIAKRKIHVNIAGGLFYIVQGAMLLYITTGGGYQSTSAVFFTFDALGSLFFALMIIVSIFAFYHSTSYLQGHGIREYRLYFTLLMLLTTAITGVYFANNIAVTWIFLEATTLCAAGILYYNHTKQSLEATWKYIFGCSTSITIAYLGILLLSTAAKDSSLNYEDLRQSIGDGNPLYLKMAFLLILCGYSCKLEIFPFYTIGVDANFAAPTPAAAMISTGLVNAGFVALFRVYKVMSASDVFGWVCSVLLITGVISLAVGALFLRRTNDYKRFLSYSTVENMGIAAIGLGVGGVGIWAAVFHAVCHTFVKSSLFFQIAAMRKLYDSYRINRIGDYIRINPIGGACIITGMIVILAFPPSPLFISELMILKQLIADTSWWLMAIILILLCIVIYSVCSRIIKLCYQPNQDRLHLAQMGKMRSWSGVSLLVVAIILGLWQPNLLQDLITKIADFR